MKKKTVFIMAPLRGDYEENLKKVLSYARKLAFKGYVPIVPHFNAFYLNDGIDKERKLAIEMSKHLITLSDEIHQLGKTITDGMSEELEFIKEIGKDVIVIKRLNAGNK
jgi:hypothetical protein